MAEFLTWGQALDYTIKYKDEWKIDHPPSQTVRINADHATQFWSRGMRISDINQGAIDELKTDYCRALKNHSDTTVKKVIQAVQTCLNYCVTRGKVVPGDPRHQAHFTQQGRFKFDTVPNNKTDRVICTPAQIDHLYNCALVFNEHLFAETIWLATYTMTSYHEWSQLQPRDLVLDVPTPYIKIGGRRDFKLKKGCRARDIYIPADSAIGDRLLPLLTKYAEEMREHQKVPIWGDYFDDARRYLDRFRRIRDYAGIDPKFTPNCCRHSGITWMAWNDVHPEKARLIAGHSQISTTLEYYTHIDHNQLAEAQSRVGMRLVAA